MRRPACGSSITVAAPVLTFNCFASTDALSASTSPGAASRLTRRTSGSACVGGVSPVSFGGVRSSHLVRPPVRARRRDREIRAGRNVPRAAARRSPDRQRRGVQSARGNHFGFSAARSVGTTARTCAVACTAPASLCRGFRTRPSRSCPSVAGVRLTQRLIGLRESDREISIPSAPVNTRLSAVLAVETAATRVVNMPLGSSLLALATWPQARCQLEYSVYQFVIQVFRGINFRGDRVLKVPVPLEGLSL